VHVPAASQDARLVALVDHGALEATLLAIVRNAGEARPVGAEVSLQVERRFVQTPLIEAHGEVAAGDWVVIRCCDNGPGIDEAALSHIFEPEFSSKGKHIETGLGLPVALARMRRMLGHLSIAPHHAGGTEVSLWLPLAPSDALARSDAARAETTGQRTTPSTGIRATSTTPSDPIPLSASSAHVLLIDDDLLVLRTADRLLQRAGFRVTTAASGFAARELLAQASLGIEVILTDVVMPGMSGPQLVAERRAVGDRRPVVYMSGYTGDALPMPQLPEAGAILVSKPFSSRTLVAAIARALAEAAAERPTG
jgi:two-component system cell cycle sensor histidine kinase/response regulator CckA